MQTPRLISLGSATPASTLGTQSASYTQENAAPKTFGATLRQCQILAQNHSDEYVLPHLAMRCGRCCAASFVIRAASRQLVWSFHSQHCASRFFAHLRFKASGTFRASTGIGLEPVESTPMPTTFFTSKPFCLRAARSAPFTLASSPWR